jgi:hypothetical protein
VGEKNLDLSQTDQAFRNSSNSSAMPTAMVNNLARDRWRPVVAGLYKKEPPTHQSGGKQANFGPIYWSNILTERNS